MLKVLTKGDKVFMRFLYRWGTIGLGVGVSLLLGATNAFAAQKVVLKYGIIRESISVQELTTFAETGKASDSLQYYFHKSKQDPQTVRRTLTQPVNANVVFLDRTLNSRPGEVFLDEVSKFVHTPSGENDRQALRASLIISASKDSQVTLMEAIQNYPTTEVEVEGERMLDVYRQLKLNALGGRWQGLFGKVSQWF